MADYNNEQWYLQLQKSLLGFTEDYLKQVSDGKLRQVEGAKRGGITAGLLTKLNESGIHKRDLRNLWASMGGYASIDKLLQWQKDNGFRVCDLERNEEWCNNISKALTGRKLSKSTIKKISNNLKEYNASLTKEERSKKYSNNARANAARIKRLQILNSIKTDTFDSLRLRKACMKFEYNFDLLARDKSLLKRIHTGKNQNDLSIYKKIK